MALLLAVLLALLVAVMFRWAPRDAFGSKPILSAYTIVLGLFFLYTVFPTILILLNSGKFVWATAYSGGAGFDFSLLLCNVALVAFVGGYFLPRLLDQSSTPSWQNLESRVVRVVHPILPIALIAVGVALKVYLVFASGGISDSLLRLSSFAQAATGIEDLESDAIGLRTWSGLADAGATWLVLRAMQAKKRLVPPMIVFSIVLLLSYVTIGKRLSLILPVVAILVGYHVYVRRITIRAAPWVVVVVLGAGMSTLLFRIFLPATVAGIEIDLNNIEYAGDSVFAFYFYSLEFSTVEMITVATTSTDSINGMFGGAWDAFVTTSLVPFLYSVPRGIWPGKPDAFYDLSHGISALLGGREIVESNVGYASTIVGTSYLTLGVAGTILAMTALGLFASRFDRNLLHRLWNPQSVVFYALGLVLVFHFFRQGTLGWTFIVAIVQQYGFLLGVAIMAIASRPLATQVNWRSKYQSRPRVGATIDGKR